MKISITVTTEDYNTIRFFDACQQTADRLMGIAQDVLDNDTFESVKSTVQAVHDTADNGGERIGTIKFSK